MKKKETEERGFPFRGPIKQMPLQADQEAGTWTQKRDGEEPTSRATLLTATSIHACHLSIKGYKLQ